MENKLFISSGTRQTIPLEKRLKTDNLNWENCDKKMRNFMSHQCLKCLPKYVSFDWISVYVYIYIYIYAKQQVDKFIDRFRQTFMDMYINR